MRLLIVEDEQALLEALAAGLTKKGYAVDKAHDGAEGYQMASDDTYDLIVLDLNLPEVSGFDLLKRLRQEKPEVKVLILTANHHLESKLTGFQYGASDYLTKPFHFAELEVRVRALLNRQFVQHTTTLTYGAITLDTLNRSVAINGSTVTFTTKELCILEYFLLHPNRLISQQEVIEHVWNGDADPLSNSIRVHMSAMRKKLISALGYDPIETKIGEGYRLL